MNDPTPTQNGEAPAEATGKEQILPLRIIDALNEHIVTQPVTWILEQLISEGEQMLIFGAPKVGKSQFALQMALSVALGRPFLKWTGGGGQRNVLYMNFEIGERWFMMRLAAHVLAEKEESTNENIGECGENGTGGLSGGDGLDGIVITEINAAIRGKFFFSNLRGMEVTSDIAGDILGARGKRETNQLLDEWHHAIDKIKPKLIVFDTLSKIHSVDERDNGAIQRILLAIRQIATMDTGAATGEDGSRPERKPLAHVIVHHSRKSGENQQHGELSLDSIRGGSAIRAEADVILGISGTESPTDGMSGVERTITIEARNIPGDRAAYRFNGITFRVPTGEDKIKDAAMRRNQLEPEIEKIFREKGVRGIPIGQLADLLFDGQAPGGRTKPKDEYVKDLRAYAQNGGEIIWLPKCNMDSQITARWPVLNRFSNSKAFYWIKENSEWLKFESIAASKAEMDRQSAEGNGLVAKAVRGQGAADEEGTDKVNHKAKSGKPQELERSSPHDFSATALEETGTLELTDGGAEGSGETAV